MPEQHNVTPGPTEASHTGAPRRLRALSISRPIVLHPRQVRLLLALFMGNGLVLALMSVLLIQALRGQPLAVVVREFVTPPPVLPTRLPPSLAGGPAPAATPFGGGGTVAFVLRREGSSNIYAVNLGDKRLIRLTWSVEGDRDPAFSPDGRDLAFASRRDGSWSIYRIDLDSGVTTRVTFSASYSAAPTWSPDSRWLAFESYQGDNMDIYVTDRDGQNVTRLTTAASPEFNPAWSPNGRWLAFAAYRGGNKEIFIRSLDTGEEINVTNSPDRDEDRPAWSHDGNRLAYSSSRLGDSAMYVAQFEWQGASKGDSQSSLGGPGQRLKTYKVELFGQGKSPTWSPDDSSLGFVYSRDNQDVLIAASLGGWGLAQQAFGGRENIDRPAWSPALLSEHIITRITAQAPPQAPPLYVEIISSPITSTPPFTLALLPGYSETLYLSDAVNDSFQSLRLRVRMETGHDYLGRLAAAWRPADDKPLPGQTHQSWHLAGRAFDLYSGYASDLTNTMEIVREDIGYSTYWRVYLKTVRQDGAMGEPLKEAPWQMDTGSDSGASGGRLKEIPPGYFIDLTALAADYGWNRTAAESRWRYFVPDAEYWHLEKTSGLAWWEAMTQIYTQDVVLALYGPYPGQD